VAQLGQALRGARNCEHEVLRVAQTRRAQCSPGGCAGSERATGDLPAFAAAQVQQPPFDLGELGPARGRKIRLLVTSSQTSWNGSRNITPL
jgi:hypothetical protein